MSPALKKTLSLRQHEIARAIGGRIDAPAKAEPAPPEPPLPVIPLGWAGPGGIFNGHSYAWEKTKPFTDTAGGQANELSRP